jgi:hypothetical protein
MFQVRVQILANNYNPPAQPSSAKLTPSNLRQNKISAYAKLLANFGDAEGPPFPFRNLYQFFFNHLQNSPLHHNHPYITIEMQ